MPNTNRPEWVDRIERYLGLKLISVERRNPVNMAEYWIMSPTGIKMFQVGGFEDDRIGMISQPDLRVIDPESLASYRSKK